jgi:glycine cleavage system H protein
MTKRTIDGFEIDTDLAYDIEAHLWLRFDVDGSVVVGVDPLGIETFGTLSQISLMDPPLDLERGIQFGSMEAEKFVGTLSSPIAGRLTATNEAVKLDPGLAERDPYGEGWLVEIQTDTGPDELAYLVNGMDAVTEAFEKRIAAYRLEGVLAE